MKGKINILARKTFAIIIATAMSIPTGMMARADEAKVYEQGSSVMNVMENPEDNNELAKTPDNTKEKENEHYKIETKAKLDESLEKIIYEIKVSKKVKQNEETNDPSNLNLKFTPNPNSNIKGLKVLSVKANSDSGLRDTERKEKENAGDLNSLLVEAKANDEIIMEVEADVRQAKENRTYDIFIGLDDGENKLDSTYNLIVNKKILTENEEEKEVLSLDLNQKESDNLKGEIEPSDLLSFLQPKDTILWTDYLANFAEEMKKVSYDIKLDDKQETTDTKISIDYYENTKEGFILKKDFAQAVDFAEKIEFEIPQGYIAKLSLKTKIDKKDTTTPNYSLNNRQVKNPRHEKKNADQTKEETGEDDGESDKSKDNTKEKTDSSTSNTQIVVKDSNGNEIPIEESPAGKEQPEISAIILNKDTLVNNLKEEDKLTEGLESIIDEISEDLNAYNDEKITDQELKDFTKSIVDRTGIEKTDLRYYFEAILSGLNKQKNKAANLNIDEIITYAYPEEKQTADETIENNTEAEEKTPDQKDTTEEVKTNEEDKPENKQGILSKIKGLMVSDEPTPKSVGEGNSTLDDKKFTIRTRFDTSNAGGPIEAGQFFIIHLDKKLTVKDPSTLKSIVYKGNVIATPEYKQDTNTIKYTVTQDINENIQVLLNIPVDYNTENITIGKDGTFTVINKVSGLGVKDPKNLVPQKIDKNGNPAGSIIEPDRDDVIKIIDDKNGNYQVPIDITGEPVVENGEMVGINWSLKVHADQSLSTLGFMANLTTVEGSGLGEIENISVNGKKVTATDQLEKALGIVDSKHHAITENIQDASYSFYTKTTNKQEKYMIDVSVFLKQKTKTGAVRFILDQGWPKEKVEEATPTRVGINNRTTIQGKFLANDKAQWTITDAISSGDEKNSGMPLADRTLDGDQTVTSGKSAVYGLNDKGEMVQIGTTKENLSDLPSKETDPSGTQAVGNIAVYQLDTQLKNADKPNNYNISGVRISKFKDLYIDQVWNFPEQGMTMPGQDFIANDNNGNELGKVHVEEGTAGQNTRFVTIPNARYWDIDEKTHEPSKRGNKIEQKFDTDTVEVNGKTYKYNENANYYQTDTKRQYIHNSAIDTTKPKPVTFTVVKVDSKDPSKKLAGATFKLLGDGNPSIVTDDQGKATFNNVLPGRYTLIEEKAPAGYKLDESQKTITIAEDGTISVNGSNIQSGGSTSATKLVQHDSAPNWPDYMNAMHYGKITTNKTTNQNEVEFYLYLKPQSDNGGNGTNRDTRLNISIPGVNITDVTAYDVSPGYRNTVKYSMEKQIADKYTSILGDNVINAANNNKITGTLNKTDPYTGKTGYQIYFPEARFANDWGFLVKVKANIGDKQSVSLDYDWLTNDNTANQTKLTQNVIINKSSGETGENQIIVTNEEFTKSPITITKFGDTFKEDGTRNRLQGAEFVLKDSNGRKLANKFTDDKGTADFGEYPPGTYRLEEVQAPDGYIKSNVYFEVVVDDAGQVTYNARFEDGIGTPQAGRDYYIEKGEETGGSNKATVTNVNQRLEYLENEPGDIGEKTGVWEAYSYESLKYHADITMNNVSPGSRFEIQFDRNFDFTQYFSEFPKIVIGGKEVADPYFDYNTNLLTYVFNDKLEKDKTTVTASINLRGIIPDKYYAKETGEYPFTIKVAAGQKGTITGNPNLTKTINADYGQHHSKTGNSNQSYYFRDVYQKEDGEWYVTVLTYLNPLGLNYSAKTVKYNWITTDFQSQRIAEWSGKGYKPLYELNDVKVYATDYGTYQGPNGVKLNYYMPLSMGIRPEQEPNIYHLLAHQRIEPNKRLDRRENDVTITYNPDQIKTDRRLDANSPLIIRTPNPRNNGGFVVEQTFKISDIEKFNTKWRAFLMDDGTLTSAFASKANVNTAIGDQAGGEIPKYYKEVIGLINNKYNPGSFKLTKYDEENQGKKLPNATFALKDENGKVIYRTSDANGVVNFDNIAPGRYSLEETRAPKGYSLTNKKWQVTILNNGSVTIRETSVTGASKVYTGNEINIPVSNKPAGKPFRVYKKDGKGQPLHGAKFRISDPSGKDTNFPIEAISDANGIVQFNGTPQPNKNYVLEEVEPPKGYNPLNKKWVLRVENNTVKIYNYSESAEGGQQVQSILGAKGVDWVDVKNRDTSNWSNYDNRWTGWAGNNENAKFLGTRIVAINKDENYVIQRYVINPEARNIADKTTASIHRQSTRDPNMDWFDMTKFDKNNDIKVFKLDKPVTGLISDIRLANYNAEDITSQVTRTASQEAGRYGEPNRLKLNIPATDKPIVIDIKVPYKNVNGGVGTGMDWVNGSSIYWKADYYETVSDIKTTGPTTSTGGTIIGAYVGENSLDVTNDIKTYGFKIKKTKEDKKTAIPGAVFKLTGPDDSQDERYETTDKYGMLSFSRLEPGKYKLEEFKPAPGYEKAKATWTVRVANDGTVYIKQNADANTSVPQKAKKNLDVVRVNSNPSANRIRQYLAQNSTSLNGVNTGLEFGPDMVEAALRAGNDWEVVDTTSSTQPKKREDVSESDYGQLIETKIIEIDKENNRYKQVFIYKPGGTAKRNRNIKFHRAYDNYNISPSEVTTRVFQVPANTNLANINESSDIDAIADKTDISKNVRFKAEGTKKIQTTDINTRYPGTILIEVETNYNENYPIGLGSNYNFNTGGTWGNKCWLEKSYANEAGVPVVKTTVNHTITFDGNGGTWKMDPVTVEENTEYELPGSSFIAPDGKEFDGWLVNGIKKNPGDRITVTSDLTIQAQWRNKAPEQVTISFSAGEGSGTMADEKVNIGSNYTLPGNGFTPPKGKEFKAWNVSGQEKQPGDVIQINANVTIKAIWKEKEPETYNVIVQNPQEGGTITAEPTSATAGTQINLTVTPDKDYKIESVTMNGTALTAGADGKYSFTMAAGDATVSATFKKSEPQGPEEGEKEIPENGFAQITNKQVGLDLKIYKKDRYDRKLEGALFTIRKTDEKYEKFDQDFGVKTGASNAKGLVEFKDKDGNIINLPKGYYVIEETAAPLGYRKPNAPWKVQVLEENGQLVAKYIGPEETPQSFVEKNEKLDIKEANGVKYATKITHIDTEARSFIQRVYIDTREKKGTVNVQITPKHKREEIDRAGLAPVTIKEGVKTAYRSTYKITGLNGDPDKAQMIKILNDYDVSTPNVTVVNTARWRPFDWGFDEDQLNLEPGVYYIDIEGFYDTSIIDRNVTNEVRINKNYNFIDKSGAETDEPVLKDPYKLTANDIPDEDLGKIDIDIKFFDGAREFQQLKNSNGKIVYGVVKDENGKDEASYQDGVETLRQWLEDNYGKEYADNWFKTKLAGQKYINKLSKIVKIGKNDIYNAGRIVPPIATATPSSTISTSMNIRSLYSSNATNTVPQEGLSVVNDAERYNITFSKHGKLTDKDSVEEITKRRLEGAVFKLEKRVREGVYEELEGSSVSSAFNGYFGFRGLEPGRYRLVEVQAPKGYKPINGPLLYFSVETVSIVSQRITDPRTGENIDVKNVEFYFPGNKTAYKFEDLEMHDPVTKKVIKFMNAKNADLETTKIIDPTDSTKKTEVSLKELSIKFPGEIKNKKGEVVKDTYKISEIQITPTSNGYISLEYDKANGVYQYIPEKSTTEENGLLVDYVTSATAKNMGKIVNEKPGKGDITIRKIDQKGDAIKATNQLPGAKFRITNKETGKTEDGTVGADGTLKFTGLNIGHYRLEEIESPNGYINNKQVWNFTVGGEDLDPYAKDAPVKRKDVSSSITLSESKLSVLNPNSKKNGLLSDNQEEMHPHLGEVFEFDNKYKIDSNLKINPGDYFVLRLSDNIDLHGIMETDISNLDIIADGVGTIAKAEYNRKEGTITYTFTNYADTYSLVEFSNKLKAYINLNKVPKAGDGTIGRGVVGHEMIKDNINVVYDSMTAREKYQGTDGKMYEMTKNHLNLGSKIIKFNPDTGEFVHYYYINRDRSTTPRSRFYYSSDQDIANLNIDYYYLDSNANLDELMPLSFGVNEDDPRLPEPVRIRSRLTLNSGQEESFTFTQGLDPNSTYLVKVTGKVVGEDKDGYVGHGVLEMIDNPARYVTRWDKQYFFKNEATAKANLIIQAVNPENKIKFKKIDQDGNPLKDATFQLFKKNDNGTWDSYGQPIKTREDGIVGYSKLPEGEYQLKETTAPDGYEKLEGAILEFEVDATGNIRRSEKTSATTDPNKQPVYVDESGSIAIPIVNKKPQKIQFEKVDASKKTTKLEGAEFEVWYKANETDKDYTTQLKVYEKTVDGKAERLVLKEEDNIPTGYKHVEGDKFVTGKNGLVEFNVLDNGYYALKEVKAPKGYIKPRDIVKEFIVKDGKIQTEQYKTEMDVKKTTGLSMANDVFQKSYTTNMTLRFNPNHEDITYVKDKSTITLSNLPLKAEIWDNKFNAKEPISITAYLVDGDNKETNKKTYKLDLTKDYATNLKASKTIDLYSLVKELENQSTEGDIKSNKTIVLSMTSSLYLKSELDIKSNIVIGDKIKEDRTFHIGTKGEEYVDHSYEFTTMGELTDLGTNPIQVENHKATFPLTGALGIFGFLIAGAIIMTTSYYKYRKKRGRALS